MVQEIRKGARKTLGANAIPLVAIMTAVTTVLTMFVKIPTPTRGYLNLSDTMIFFSAYAFGPWVGGIIGGTLFPDIRNGPSSPSSSTAPRRCWPDR